VAVIPRSELPQVGAVRVMVGGLPVAVVRCADGTVHAIGDLCTHADVSLSEGEVEDCSIECWLHGSRFDLGTGRPLALPAIRPVPVYRVTVDGENVYINVNADVRADVADVNAEVSRNVEVNAEVTKES
jgi:3-phenylpropionate/trans-cinnamate dioxygenase ferredoxin subunit